MKIIHHMVLILLVFLNHQETIANAKVVVKTSNFTSLDLNYEAFQQETEYHYVSAKSGLNYRKSPKGELIGKFPLNTALQVVKRTKIFEAIVDDGKTLSGEWLGVVKDIDTVYVFGGFLSKHLTRKELNIYNASPFYKSLNDNSTRTGFLNLSESNTWDAVRLKETLFTDTALTKATIRLTANKKELFLQRRKIKKTDTVFIYDLLEDKIFKFKVANLPAIAVISPYSFGDSIYRRYDYQLGLNLERKQFGSGVNFVCIGEENPFETGNAKVIIWNKIEANSIPKKYAHQFTEDEIKYGVLKGAKLVQSYHYTNENLDYYMHDVGINQVVYYHKLIVVNNITGKILSQHNFSLREISTLIAVKTNQEDKILSLLITGKVFKDRPSILYSTKSHSFGCPSIEFVEKGEPPIFILCDNRH